MQKVIIILIATLLYLPAAAGSQSPVGKRISVGTFRRLCVPQLIKMYGLRDNGTLVRQYRPVSHGNAGISIEETAHQYKVRIIQTLDNGICLARCKKIRQGSIFAVNLGQALPDESIYKMYLQPTSALYTYTAVTGAGRTVALYNSLILPPATEAALLKAFAAGKKFDVQLPLTAECPVCKGRGRLSRNHRSIHQGRLCPRCKGKGIIEVPEVCRVSR